MQPPRDLEETVVSLIEDERYHGHPLHEALDALYARYAEHARQLERITRIADRYQQAEHVRGQTYAQRYERQLHQLSRLVRISDRYQRALQELNDELREQSERDELTRLYNRRYMYARLDEEGLRLSRGGAPFAVALADIDLFKQINDGWGHDIGDKALREVAQLLQGRLRGSDSCARWGGEEFLILMPQTDLDGALALISDLRQALREASLSQHSDLPPLTMSFGVCVAAPGQSSGELLRQIDLAMYQAKHQGRDRVQIAA